MANTKSIEKVENYLMANRVVTYSGIIKGANLPATAVREILSLLEKYGRINQITNGKVTMVQYLDDKNE